MNRPADPVAAPIPRPSHDVEPLAVALARLESRWGSAAIRLGNGADARVSIGALRCGNTAGDTAIGRAAGDTSDAGATFPVEGALAPLPVRVPPAPDPLAPLDDRVVPTGFPALDAILGPGGLVRDAQVTLRGDASSGKTTLALRLVAEAQSRGAIAAWLDLGRAFDPLEAVARGVDLEWLLVLRVADTAEGLRLAGALLGGRAVEILVADLPDRAPLDEGLLRRLAARARQVRARLVTLEPTGLPSSLRGALAESTGVGLELQRLAWIRAGRDVVGQRTEVTVEKNRFGPPGRRAALEIRYADEGDRERGVERFLDAGPPGPTVPVAVLTGRRVLPPGDRDGRDGRVPRGPDSGARDAGPPPPILITPEHDIASSSDHATPPSRLASSAPSTRARGAPAPGGDRARRSPVGPGTRPRLQPGGAPSRDPAGDDARRRARPRA
ncbi:MAG: hypothetical protein M0Z49_16105 [Chloroflexi bacterium]|nr:hypothetical protein [Chloroflexota bacterium]